MRNRLYCFVLSTVLQTISASCTFAAEARDRHVMVLCVDGLPAYLFADKNAPMPNIRKLAAEGVVAEGMIVANPAVTWPNHTSLMTGVWPERHGVLFNGVLERPGLGLPIKVNPRKDKLELVQFPTIYDSIHEQGMTIAAINWPCTRNASTIHDDFPDVPESFDFTTPRLIAGMKDAGIVTDADIREFMKLSSPARDHIWTQAVCHVIRERKPNLTLFHLLNVDSIHHRYGPQTAAGYSAVAYADSCIRDVIDAIDAAGIRDRTTIMIVSDHGFISVPRTLQPNVVLRQAGLLTVENDQASTARAHVYPEGGIGMVYLTVPDTYEEDRRKVIELFRDRNEIAEILTPADYSRHGLPLPADNRQMADLILVAKEGFGFSLNPNGDDFVVNSQTTVGMHGFLSTNSKMNATFIASGYEIKKGATLGLIENRDVAPTIARLLGVPFDSADGKVLSEAIEQ